MFNKNIKIGIVIGLAFLSFSCSYTDDSYQEALPVAIGNGS